MSHDRDAITNERPTPQPTGRRFGVQKNSADHCPLTLIRHCPLNAGAIDSHLHLYADFSNKGFGGVVAFTTRQNDGLTLSRFISRPTKGAEVSYVAINGETCATLWIIRQSQKDIMRTKTTTVWTDHADRCYRRFFIRFSNDAPTESIHLDDQNLRCGSPIYIRKISTASRFAIKKPAPSPD